MWRQAQRTNPVVRQRERDNAKRRRRENPEYWKAKKKADNAARRARLYGVPRETIDPARVWEADNGVCHLGNHPADPNDWHMDHVIPLKHGGPHMYVNLRVSCPAANEWKNDRLMGDLDMEGCPCRPT